jgi:hypothetical protein
VVIERRDRDAIVAFLGLMILVLFALLFTGCPPSRPTVLVDVCAATNALPGPYCPSVVARKFYADSKPTAICALHVAPDPEPDPYTGPLLTTFAPDIIIGGGDVAAFADSRKAAGIMGVRFFVLFTQYPARGAADSLQPWIMYRTWTAGYSGPADLPFYDLTREDPAYWARLRLILGELKRAGLWADLSLTTCPPGGREKYYHPFLSSIQKRNPDVPDEPSKLTDGYWGNPDKPESATLLIWHRRFAERVIQVAREVGVRFRVEIGNELWWQSTPPTANDWPRDFGPKWVKWYIGVLTDAGVPLSDIFISVMQPNVRDEIADMVGFYANHGAVLPAQVTDETWIAHARLAWSGDGGFNGTGDADAKGRRGLGESDAAALAGRIRALGYPGYEYMSRRLWQANNYLLDLDAFNPAPARAIAETWGIIRQE